MQKQLARLAVAHVVLIVYAVLSAAVFLKIRYGSTHPAYVGDWTYASYVLHLKDYGVLLLAIPAVWGLYVLWQMKKPTADSGAFSEAYLSGVIIAVGLFFVGVSTTSVLSTTSLHDEAKPDSSISGSRFDKVEPAPQP